MILDALEFPKHFNGVNVKTDVNIQGKSGGSITKALPGWPDHYIIRRELIIQRNRAESPEQKERINVLLAQLDTYQWAEPKHRTVLAPLILRQMALL